MSATVIRIATRQSPLALWQANYVREQLLTIYPMIEIKLIPLVTRGDQQLETPLSKLGGKGLFVKELELALLEGRADIAVHSMKDVPITFPIGLGIITICQRDDPRDALVTTHYKNLQQLPKGAIVGTSSLRRSCQLQNHYPHLQFKELRGNVGTRLNKLDSGEYDAIILAAAGLKRLQLAARIAMIIPPELCLPAAGQGAIGIECRLDDQPIIKMIKALHEPNTAACVTAERAVNIRLDGGCQTPIGAYAHLQDKQLSLQALICDPDNNQIINTTATGNINAAEQLGTQLAEQLLSLGAKQILQRFNPSSSIP